MDNEYLKEQEGIALIGNALEDLTRTEGFKVFIEHVLEPMDRAAFETFKKVPAEETTSVLQTQIISKVINGIRADIDKKIQAGRLARDTLINSTQEEEDEL